MQVGSHYHFAEANAALAFDRAAARGRGSTCRPAPRPLRARQSPSRRLVALGAGSPPVPRAPRRRRDAATVRRDRPRVLSRARYAALYGPTTGDRVRLADTDLLIEIEQDLCGGPGLAGDEAVFGGGKVIRESMGQSRRTAAAGHARPGHHRCAHARPLGIIKADIGIRDGRIVGSARPATPTPWTACTPAW